jgi:hypothetical protein
VVYYLGVRWLVQRQEAVAVARPLKKSKQRGDWGSRLNGWVRGVKMTVLLGPGLYSLIVSVREKLEVRRLRVVSM